MAKRTDKFKFYTNGIKTIKIYEGMDIPEGFYRGRTYKSNPWNKGLTKDTSEKVKKNSEKAHQTRDKKNYPAWNKGLTKETDERVLNNYIKMIEGLQNKYGVSNAGQLPHEAWNKGLTADTDESMKKASDNHKGWWDRKTKEEQDEITDKHRIYLDDGSYIMKEHLTAKQNGSYKKSSFEERVYAELIEKYGEDNIVREYQDSRYSRADGYCWKCDFYVISEDLFIEVMGHQTHGTEPFDETNIKHLILRSRCKIKPKNWVDEGLYKTWAGTDVLKRKVAIKNNLNYMTIY